MHLVVSSRTSSDLRIRLFCILHLRIFGFGYSTTSTSSDLRIRLPATSTSSDLWILLRFFSYYFGFRIRLFYIYIFGYQIVLLSSTPSLDLRIRTSSFHTLSGSSDYPSDIFGPSSIFEAEDSSDSLELSDTFIRLRPTLIVEELLLIRIHPNISSEFIRILLYFEELLFIRIHPNISFEYYSTS